MKKMKKMNIQHIFNDKEDDKVNNVPVNEGTSGCNEYDTGNDDLVDGADIDRLDGVMMVFCDNDCMLLYASTCSSWLIVCVLVKAVS